jgi:quercetin dioxygenase-like cupin family protein
LAAWLRTLFSREPSNITRRLAVGGRIFVRTSMLNIPSVLAAATLGLSLTAVTADSPPSTTPPPAPVRTILEHHDLTGVPGKEVFIGTANLPAGTVIGYHTHAGDEFAYVLKGPLVLKKKGEPDRILQTGDTFFNARGVIHSLTTLPGADNGTALSVWIIDKGSPLSIPAVR